MREGTTGTDVILCAVGQILDTHLPGGYLEKEELDLRSVIRKRWAALSQLGEDVSDRLAGVQNTFKRQLGKDVKEFVKDVTSFRGDFEVNGPAAANIPAHIAMERLAYYKDQFENLERKMVTYSSGTSVWLTVVVRWK